MSKLYKEKIVNYLKNESDSVELGFDREKLSYIPNYFSSYLSQGRIPNFICLVSRYGEVAHYSHQGFKNIDKKDEINNEVEKNNEINNEMEINNEINNEMEINNEINGIETNNEINSEIEINNEINNEI